MATAQEAITSIQTFTTKSQALQAQANSINIASGPLIVTGQGPFPKIIAGFNDITNTTTASIGELRGTLGITDAQTVADAFTQFVNVYQARQHHPPRSRSTSSHHHSRTYRPQRRHN
ncbi:hypothetical protein V502_04564 [Pseudogymnoascus sp. VKM F-4520 (FW-2644)]|nr:hypothetical protein V502_04564 [Pseudogymnoascus sp. VKM F-4520 (FW-2644)]